MADEEDFLYEELYDSFDSHDLLTAVDHLDQIRYRLPEGPNFEPPKVRQNLMKLHEMVMHASNYGSARYSHEDIYEELDEIQTVVLDISEHADKLYSILSRLETVFHKVWERIEEAQSEEEE